MMTKKSVYFIGLAYVLCWTIAFSYFSGGGSVQDPYFSLVALACMFTPALAALLVQKVFYHAPLEELGLSFTFNRWFVGAWLLPVGLVGFAIGASALVPGASLSFGMEAVSSQLEGVVSAEQAAELRSEMEGMGPALPFVLIGGSILAALVAGPTINAVPALGEELGWRGLLQKELAPLGFWRASGFVGVVWGIWHLPLIIHGYNYPDHPVAGVFMMTLMTVLLAPIFAYVQQKAESVLAPAILHGVYNALAGLPLLVVMGGDRLTIGMTGAAGAAVLLLVNGGIFLLRRRERRTVSSPAVQQ